MMVFVEYVFHLVKLKDIRIKQQQIIASSGVTLSSLAQKALLQGLSGLEFAAGIPGTLGGALYMNAGAYGQEIKDIINKATVYTIKGQKIILSKKELKLSYRSSILQQKPYVLIKAKMKLQPAPQSKIKNLMTELKEKRKNKQPLSWPSAGSIFKRPPDDYAGRLVEKSRHERSTRRGCSGV